MKEKFEASNPSGQVKQVFRRVVVFVSLYRVNKQEAISVMFSLREVYLGASLFKQVSKEMPIISKCICG